MNRFIFCRPFLNIKRDKKIYIVVIVQLIGAFVMLNIFLSILLNIFENKRNLLQENENMKYQINVQDNTFEYSTFDIFEWEKEENLLQQEYIFPFNQSNIEIIMGKCTHCTFSVDVKINLLYLGELIDDDDSVQICYSSEYSNVQMSKKMESILLDINEENTINLKDFPYNIDNNCIKDVDGDLYSIEYIEDKSRTVYMPIEMYYKKYHPKDLNNTTLNIELSELSFINEIKEAIYILQKQCGENFQFDLENDFSAFLAEVMTAEKDSEFLIFIAIIIICIVLIGMIGNFVIIIKRREREIAIFCALGQTKRNVCFEVFMEVLILNMSSYLLGIIISESIIKSGISLATVEIKYNIYSIIILFGVTLLLSCLVIIPVKLLIEKQSPIEILASL